MEILSERNGQAWTDDRLFVLDPRVPEYEPVTWHARGEANQVARQLDWELRGVDLANEVVFNFQAGVRSPIALMLLGTVTLRAEQVLVRVEPGFWRADYVRELCRRTMMICKDELADIGALAKYRL